MNPSEIGFREFFPFVLMLGGVVWSVWEVRRRLSKWHLIIAAFLAFISVPTTLYMVTEMRAGNYSGWGGLGALMVLLPAGFVAVVSVTVLATLAVLVPRYGFNPLSAEQRAALRAHRQSPAGRKELAMFKLKMALGGLVIALLVYAARLFGP